MDGSIGTPGGQNASQASFTPAIQRSDTAGISMASSHSSRLEIHDHTPADRHRPPPSVISPLRTRTPKMNNLNFPGPGTRIHATTTAAQNEIYKLERQLEKVFQNYTSSHGAFASFISQENMLLEKSQTATAPLTNRLLHPRRQGTANLHTAGPNNIPAQPLAMNSKQASAFLLNNIAEIIKKHPGATRLPMMHDVLGALEAPFLVWPVEVDQCNKALEIFEYINSSFKERDQLENFQLLLWCCRQLSVPDFQLKMRVISMVKFSLAPTTENSKALPSTPSAIYSLVNILMTALFHLHDENGKEKKLGYNTDDNRQSFQNEYNHVRDSILDLLDQLANAGLITLNKECCEHYLGAEAGPDFTPQDVKKVVKYCIMEGICKCFLNRRVLQENKVVYSPPSKIAESVDRNTRMHERKCEVLFDLLERYWIPQGEQCDPGFKSLAHLFCSILSESVSMTTDNSKSSLGWLDLVSFFQKHLSFTTLHTCFQSNAAERDKIINDVINALLRILCVKSAKDSGASPRLDARTYSDDIEEWNSQDFSVRKVKQPILDNVTNEVFTSTVQSVNSYLDDIWNDGFNVAITSLVKEKLQQTEWSYVVPLYSNLTVNRNINDKVGSAIVKETLPTLFQRLVSDLPQATPDLCHLLSNLAKQHKIQFYKPIITCIASNSENKIVKSLVLIISLRQYLSGVQMWMRDAEMMSVIILGDVGKPKTDIQPSLSSTIRLGDSSGLTSRVEEVSDASSCVSDTDSKIESWRTTTLGQCAVVAEFIWAIKELRDRQKDRKRDMEDDEIAKKFLIDLERQLSIILVAKEKTKLIPLPLRVLVANMFLEIRFFCNTTHRPGWLSRSIEWCTHILPASDLYRFASMDGQDTTGDFAYNFSAEDHHNNGQQNILLDDVSMMFQRLRILYANVSSQVEGDFDVFDFDRPVSALPRRPTNEQQLDGSAPASSSQSSTALDIESITTAPTPVQIQRIKFQPTSAAGQAALDISPPPLKKGEQGDPMPMAQPGKSLILLTSQVAKNRLNQIADLNQDPFGSVLSLLVAVFATINEQELTALAAPLWNRYMDDRKHQAFPAAAFLLMQCGEKVPEVIVNLTSKDLYSENPMRRLSGLRILSSLFGYRFNILTQDYIPVTSRRLPFRSGAGAISTPFVLTDLGNNKFTLDEPRWMSKLKHSGNFPVEIKRQIQELGWDENEQTEEHEAFLRELTPLTILPLFYLDEEDGAANEAAENKAATNQQLMGNSRTLQKTIKSAAKNPLSKRRAATVPALSVASLSMVDLLDDVNGGIFNGTRELIDYFLREDPSVFLRVFLGDLSKATFSRQKEILTRLRMLVNMQAKLPPAFAHSLFNFLAGMLKWYAKEGKDQSLGLMNLVHPVLAELVFSINDLATRDLRKNKIEYLLASTGHFWFKTEQPASMFPRSFGSANTILRLLEVPVDVFRITLLRISHYQFLTNFLQRFPREVYAIKKTMTQYEPLPTLDEIDGIHSAILDDEDYYIPKLTKRRLIANMDATSEAIAKTHTNGCDESPLQRRRMTSKRAENLLMLSALRARCWIKFVDSLLIGLNKNFNDRDDLEKILTGVNSIIITHQKDFELLGQALTLYTRVASKFKRLFSSNRGYYIFLPALFKVYCECEDYVPVRSAIVFAWCRFLAIHEEAFIFQMLGCLVPMILSASQKSSVVGQCMVDNLFELLKCMSSPPRLGATSDVLGVQLQFELDEHGRLVQQQLDNISNPIAVPLSKSILKPLARSMTAPMIAIGASNITDKSFPLEDSVKLFLTIIAYDSGALRAEQFVIMFRNLLVHFMKVPRLSELIDEGIAALINVFFKFAKTARPSNSVSSAFFSGGASAPLLDSFGNPITRNDLNERLFSSRIPLDNTTRGPGKNWLQNDRLTVKKEFVRLVQEYFHQGGKLTWYGHDKMGQIIKLIIKDSGTIRGLICPTDWIRDYIVDTVTSIGADPEGTKSIQELLQHIYTQFRPQWRFIDAADMYDGLATVLEKSSANAVIVSGVGPIAIEKFVCFGLSIATRHDWDPEHQSMQKRFQQSLVRLILAILENTPYDVMHEIEAQVPSATLIGIIIIPICLQYNLKDDYNPLVVNSRRKSPTDITNIWARLLGIVMRACNKASMGKAKSGGFSLSALTNSNGQNDNLANDETLPEEEQTMSSSSSFKMTFVIGFTALKIIMLRGQTAFNTSKKLWLRTALFAQQSLKFGETLARSRTRRGGNGMPASPNFPVSPDTISPEAVTSNFTASFELSVDHQSSFSGNVMANDQMTSFEYTLWTFLEFVVSYKQPLIIYMRTFIHQKIYEEGNMHLRLSSSPRRGEFSRQSRGSVGSPISSDHHTPNPLHRWRSWGGQAPPSVTIQKSPSLLSASGSDPEQIHHLSLNSPVSPRSPVVATSNASLSPGLPAHTLSPVPSIPSDIPDHRSADYRRPSHVSMANSSNQSYILPGNADQNSKYAAMQSQAVSSFTNVQRSMGYQVTNTNESHPPLLVWSKAFALEKLTSEWKFVTQTYPYVFYLNETRRDVDM
ncbi:hypothetical protein K450DRAFT_276562 [Umbelopsis ramanniana AG]|uniref:Protein UNC80 C-terminal domain-containing protein n=1 Tax=Umbelopsis ramanniana AG TaxID=1314678 RepID=A0AAD5EIY7_UMBRA|nr:uncharacterized protein K450DRAFT_276562 [Umbelopsis ramanniana AG]KAI8584187.1 hypothetical protein K450DRAFT_276562 [Umbelopsis ramanniana AG]